MAQVLTTPPSVGPTVGRVGSCRAHSLNAHTPHSLNAHTDHMEENAQARWHTSRCHKPKKWPIGMIHNYQFWYLPEKHVQIRV
jgi:hypothetical protein